MTIQDLVDQGYEVTHKTTGYYFISAVDKPFIEPYSGKYGVGYKVTSKRPNPKASTSVTEYYTK